MTSFLVCILITSFCRKLLGIRDTQPRLGFSARTHPRVLALERAGRNSFPYTPPRRERWSVGRECRSVGGKGTGGGGMAFINLRRKKGIYFGRGYEGGLSLSLSPAVTLFLFSRDPLPSPPLPPAVFLSSVRYGAKPSAARSARTASLAPR